LCNLGYLYENGEGVPMDRSEAVKWYKLAAERGHKGAKESIERLRIDR
jgi:TPR repeat protein